MKVLVTGANGFVGTALIERLLEEGHHVSALVRNKHKIKKHHDKIKWLEGDLLKPETLSVLKNIDRAYYLVHGLQSEERFFEYEESLAAVNFINWLRPTEAGVIYLGGLGPTKDNLSPHLRSRHLTGAILGASGLSMIEFRASIILGEGSLSFEIIKAMAERFPFRPELSLLNHPSQPLALSDLLDYLVAALDLPNEGHQIFEIGGPDVMTYGELIDLYAELAGLNRRVIKLPEVDVKVLMKALDYAIPEHSQIGRKLTESLEHATVVTNDRAQKAFPEIKPKELRVAMDIARASSKTYYAPIWEKDFLKMLLSDKILTQSGLLTPELLRNLERVGKIKDILSRK
ncbi:NAD-dependent epimerase/dehydratase family protein [Peredibacter sp. HCB2-198]|uniref:NAD-dependent epimerase/dehydratase family protein n=1 Tax=Peredibacter sp. HCB2-198 TaxID=3383025 RepID=UPI0038B541AB